MVRSLPLFPNPEVGPGTELKRTLHGRLNLIMIKSAVNEIDCLSVMSLALVRFSFSHQVSAMTSWRSAFAGIFWLAPCVEVFIPEESTVRRWVTLARDMNKDLADHIEQYPWVPMSWICNNKYVVGIGATANDKLKFEFAKTAFDLANEKYLAG